MHDQGVEFRCPECQSSHYGYGDTHGTCHGDGCAFRWHRRDEWGYFMKVLSFESAQEYRNMGHGNEER